MLLQPRLILLLVAVDLLICLVKYSHVLEELLKKTLDIFES